MKIIIFGLPQNGDKEKQYGDCILIYDHMAATIFDCGSIEHAEKVIKKLNSANVKDTYIIVSHPDKDHIDGVNRLCNENSINVKGIYTIDPKKYRKSIYQEVESNEKISTFNKLIDEKYENLYLLDHSKIKDIYDYEDEIPFIKLCGPNKDFLINKLSTLFDKNESDNSHSTTIVNEVSIQCKVPLFDNKYLLLTGDSTYEALKQNLSNDIVVLVLPHHGNYENANKIFEHYDNQRENNIVYIVSDNTGNTNGGSDELQKDHTGHHVIFTCVGNNGNNDIDIDELCIDKRSDSYGSTLLF